MLNPIFVFLIVAAVLTAAFTGDMGKVNGAVVSSAKTAVELAVGLVGQMALWLGLMAVLREAGALRSLSRSLAPLLRRLFPDVPADHPAMSAIVMNLGANILGLTNAATPFGIKAMYELAKLNRHKGVASDSMALFLAINVSGVAVIPVTTVAVRAAAGSQDPTGVILPSLLSSAINTVFAVLLAKWLQGWGLFSAQRAAEGLAAEGASAPLTSPPEEEKEEAPVLPDHAPTRGWRRVLVALVVGVLLAGMALKLRGQPGWDAARVLVSEWLLPVVMVAIVLFGFGRRVRTYEVFVQTAKEGFTVAVSLIPYLVAILVAIGMFRASGALDAIVRALAPLTDKVGFPAEALPMALIRPLSGGGTVAVLSDTLTAQGPDTFVGYFTSVLSGTSETTFYVLAVYFGAVGIRAIRHTLWVCLAADVVGVVASLVVCRLYFAA